MNYAERLRQAAYRGLQAIKDDDDETLDQLVADSRALSLELEVLVRPWADSPAGIEETADDLDQAHLDARKAYLGICELIDSGASLRQSETLDQALSELEKAAEALSLAESLPRPTLFNEPFA